MLITVGSGNTEAAPTPSQLSLASFTPRVPHSDHFHNTGAKHLANDLNFIRLYMQTLMRSLNSKLVIQRTNLIFYEHEIFTEVRTSETS